MRKIVDLKIVGGYKIDQVTPESYAYIKIFGNVPFFSNGILKGVDQHGQDLYYSRPVEQANMEVVFSNSDNRFNFSTGDAGWVKYINQGLIRKDMKLKWISVDNYLNADEDPLCSPLLMEKDYFKSRDVLIAPKLNSDGRYYWFFDGALNEQNVCLLAFTEMAEDGAEFNFQFCFETERDLGNWDAAADAEFFGITKTTAFTVTFDENMTVAAYGEPISSGDEVRRGTRLVLSHDNVDQKLFLYYNVNGQRLDGANIIVTEDLDIEAVYVEVAIQSISPDISNYNPAVSIVLERNAYGEYIDDADHTKGWYLAKADAAEMTSIPSFQNITAVTDANAIVVASEGDVTTSYDFDDFAEIRYFGLLLIADSQFYMCISLQLDLTNLPKTITSIGSVAFVRCANCYGDIDLPNLEILGQSAFGGGANGESGAGVTRILDLGKITSIPEKTFSNCYSLVSAILPDTVKKIGNNAFAMWNSNFGAFTSIIMPSALETIGNSAFQFCYNLAYDLTNLPKTITSIGSAAFGRCANCYGDIDLPNLEILGQSAFGGGPNSDNVGVNVVNIKSLGQLTSISNEVFKNAINMKTVVFPATVTSLGNNIIGVILPNTCVIESIVALSDIPPTYANSFLNVPADCAIYVPAASVTAYQTSAGWSERAAYIQAIPTVTLGADVAATLDGEPITSGDMVLPGSTIELTYTGAGTLDYFTANGTQISGNIYTVSEAVTIAAVLQ